MRILFIEGDDELDAMLFERRFTDLEDVATGVAEAGGMIEVEDAGGDFAVTLRILEFGAIDPDFIVWIMDNFADYDELKTRNFHLLKEATE